MRQPGVRTTVAARWRQQQLLVGLLVMVLIATLTGAGGAAAEEVLSEPDLTVEEFESAPEVAERLLAAAEIAVRYGSRRGGGSHVTDVARAMGPGTDFDEVPASEVEAYECAVATFLLDGVPPAEVSNSACAPPNELSFTAVSAGRDHTCAIADDTAYCWGNGSSGQLGNGTTDSSSLPVAVTTDADLVASGTTASALPAGAEVTAISAGFEHTCAVADDTAYCWGNQAAGRLGDGGDAAVGSPPVAVATDGDSALLSTETVTTISAGFEHTCAVADGAAYCWGGGGISRLLGTGGNARASLPVAVATDVDGYIDTGVGIFSSALPSTATVTTISASSLHTCAVAGGAAYCWGQNSRSGGRLGNGPTDNGGLPVAVATDVDGYIDTGVGIFSSALPSTATVTTISAGAQHTCAVADADAYCWGSDGAGQLGNGTTTTPNQPLPVAVATDGLSALPAGAEVTAISAGGTHSCAVASGAAYCWGSAGSGQLGNGNTTVDQPKPVRVLEPA